MAVNLSAHDLENRHRVVKSVFNYKHSAGLRATLKPRFTAVITCHTLQGRLTEYKFCKGLIDDHFCIEVSLCMPFYATSSRL